MKLRLLTAAALVALLPAQAFAGNTTLYSPTQGDLVFPLSPPAPQTSAPGALDNTTIGATTPQPGTFTALSAASQKFTGTAPVPTGTGTPTIAAGSTDSAGEVTAGASATSVIITFNSVKASAPFCEVTSQTQLAAFAYTISTSAISITQTATSGNKIDYHCDQH